MIARMLTVKEELDARIEAGRNSVAYKTYEKMKSIVLEMLQSQAGKEASHYWKQELEGLYYILDASPLIIEKLRHHTYHITGLYEYTYREHHLRLVPQFAQKLSSLRELDENNLLVPESLELGGFGYEIDGALYNLDTLKFYEVLIGLDRSGFLDEIREGRKTVMEIGSGWGGLAYQFKTLFPNSTYVMVDLPMVILFSSVYLQTLFPNAKVFLGDGNAESYNNINLASYDFVFIPHYAWSHLSPMKIDLVLNTASFQEMTEEHVRGYVKQLANWKVPHIYSLNRDHSPNNPELASVSAVLSEYYQIEEQPVLPVPYHTLTFPKQTLVSQVKKIIKKTIKKQPQRFPHEYRHIKGLLKP
jgi:hypothetical protein